MTPRAYLLPVFLVVIEAANGAPPASQPLPAPTLEVEAHVLRIDDHDPSMILVEVEFSWVADHADYVLILGGHNDAKKHPARGSIRNDGGSFVFVAVGGGGITSARKGLVTRWKQGTGVNGLIHNSDHSFDPSSFFKKSFKWSLKTTLDQKELENVIVQVLQDWGLTAAVISTPEEGTLVFTSNFIFHAQLGLINGVSFDEERMLRQVAFEVWVRPKDDTSAEYKIDVRPIVMMRKDKGGAPWILDPDEAQTGQQACKELSEAVFRKVKGQPPRVDGQPASSARSRS